MYIDIISLKLLPFKNSEDRESEGEYFGDSGIALGFCGGVHPLRVTGLERGAAIYELVLFKKIIPFTIETYWDEIKEGRFQKLLWKDENGKKYRTLSTLTRHLTLKGFKDFYDNSTSVEDFIKKGEGLSKFFGYYIYF